MSKILYVSPFYYPSMGGLETFCKEIATRVAKLNHDVSIITQNVKSYPSYEEIDGVKIYRIKPWFRIYKGQFMPNIQKIIQKINPDVIHIQGPAPGVAEFTMKNTNAKIIMTLHNDLDTTNSLMYKIITNLYRLIFISKIKKRLDKLIILHPLQKQRSKIFYDLPSSKVSIIPNGIDLEKFSPGKKSKKEYKNNLGVSSKFLILFVGSMEPLHVYKGVKYLLQAISHIKNVDVTFHFIGDGSLKQQYLEISKKFNILDKVKFVGKVDEEKLVEYYRASDVFVLPSTSTEAMPIVILEAMSCSNAIITTRIPGPMGMINNGYNGYLVEPKNPTELSNTIMKLLSNESLLLNMQKNARTEVVSKYSWVKILKQYIQEYSL